MLDNPFSSDVHKARSFAQSQWLHFRVCSFRKGLLIIEKLKDSRVGPFSKVLDSRLYLLCMKEGLPVLVEWMEILSNEKFSSGNLYFKAVVQGSLLSVLL